MEFLDLNLIKLLLIYIFTYGETCNILERCIIETNIYKYSNSNRDFRF